MAWPRVLIKPAQTASYKQKTSKDVNTMHVQEPLNRPASFVMIRDIASMMLTAVPGSCEALTHDHPKWS